jgi:D-alanyl-D-alanine carboxypeptidase
MNAQAARLGMTATQFTNASAIGTIYSCEIPS